MSALIALNFENREEATMIFFLDIPQNPQGRVMLTWIMIGSGHPDSEV